MKPQQGIGYQLDMFTEHKQKSIRHSENREDVNGAKAGMEKQVKEEGQQGRALTESLMPIICSSQNIKAAYRQVKRNKGVAGIDQMPIGDFATWFNENGETLITELMSGTYRPEGVKQVEIPKLSGGMRKLGRTNGNRPYHSTSHSASVKSNLRTTVFRIQLRISPQAECAPSTKASE